MRTTLRLAFSFFPVLVCGAPVNAQTDADTKELASYRLTMAAVHRVDAATEAMVAEMKKDPRYQEQLKLTAEITALEEKDERTEAEDARLEQLREKLDALESAAAPSFEHAETLTQMEAAIRQFPPMAQALRSVGMPPREYAKFMLAMFQGATAAGMKKAGLLKELPPGVLAENVKFVEEHEAELTALQKKWDTMGKEGR